ncbi:MAG TPA: hypothetical protein VHH09_04695 [Acidimicrobiales bacterium]|nr:hypothetical protein [Acidimicrobiales bacterium]
MLSEGRAVGEKQLREYMEVKGYADAADWVYRQAIQPGGWQPGSILNLTEVRQVYSAQALDLGLAEPFPTDTCANYLAGPRNSTSFDGDAMTFSFVTPPSGSFVPRERRQRSDW